MMPALPREAMRRGDWLAVGVWVGIMLLCVSFWGLVAFGVWLAVAG